MKKMALCLAVSAVALSGCASVEQLRPDIAAKPMPSRLDEIALINELRSAYQIVPAPRQSSKQIKASKQIESTKAPKVQAVSSSAGSDSPSWNPVQLPSVEGVCFSGADLREFKSKTSQGFRDGRYPEEYISSNGDLAQCITFKNLPDDESVAKGTLIRYMTAGFGLTDIYCRRFFIVASASQQNRKFGRGLANGVDVLVGSILSLGNAGETAIGITNSGFGLIDSTFQNFEDAFAVGPELSDVELLVNSAQREFRLTAIDPENSRFPQSYGQARSTIERYASFCSFTGMKQLVNRAVGDLTRNLVKKSGSDTKPPQPQLPPTSPQEPNADQGPPATVPELTIPPETERIEETSNTQIPF